jgi:hypothetical protein
MKRVIDSNYVLFMFVGLHAQEDKAFTVSTYSRKVKGTMGLEYKVGLMKVNLGE